VKLLLLVSLAIGAQMKTQKYALLANTVLLRVESIAVRTRLIEQRNTLLDRILAWDAMEHSGRWWYHLSRDPLGWVNL